MNGADRRVKFALALFVLGATGRALAVTPAPPEIPKTLPDGFALLPFENRSGVTGLDWLRAALPAALGEKLESDSALRAVYGELVIPDGAPGAEIAEAEVLALASKTGARFVFTGRYTRPNWKLELVLSLWQVDAGKASIVGEITKRGDFSDCFTLLDESSAALLTKAGKAIPPADVDKVKRAPTPDFYAFTLYGRGLTALHGMGGTVDLGKAEKDLSRAVFIDPKFAEAHRLLALVHERRGKTAKARGQLTYALDLRPDYYAPLSQLVRSAYAAKDRESAIPLAVRALTIRPWDFDVRYYLADMLWEEGDADGAYRELLRLTAVKPDHLPSRRILVLIHASQGHGEELASELEKIIQLDPSDDDAKLDLGAAYHALGRDGDAIAIYDAVVQKNPKHLQALKFLGDLYRSRGDLTTAIELYEKALAANKDDPRPYFLLGKAYVEAGDAKAALKIYKEAQRFKRYLGETYSNLGAIYYKEGDNDTAIWYLHEAVKKRPDNPRVRYNYALALSRAHKRQRALAELRRASELDPDEAEFRYAMGVLLLRLGRIEEAEQAFLECARLDPAHDDARHNLRLIEELRRRAKEGEIQID